MNAPLPSSPFARKTAGKPRLLVVEDEPSMSEFLSELLESEYAVETAMDGEQAWDAIQQAKPDLVLSNVNMPVLDGVGLIQRLRASSATASLPILLLTARMDHSSLAAAANGLVQKPFRPGELLAALRTLSQATQPLPAKAGRLEED